jgi:hypothetical protein
VQARRAVLDGRVVERIRSGGAAEARADVGGGGAVDVGEGLEEALGVAEGDALVRLRGVGQVLVAALVDFFRFAGAHDRQVVRILLMPLQRGVGPVDAEAQVVLFPERDLRAVQDALRTALVAHQHVGVVFQPPALDEGRGVGKQLAHLEARDVAREVLGVRPDVAEGARAGLLGVGAPAGLLVALLLQRRGEPALRVLGDDLANGAQLAVPHQIARLLDQRVAGVVVREREHDVLLIHETAQRFRVAEGGRHRLVADDVEAFLDEGPRDVEVQNIGRDDAYEVDALSLRQLGFLPRHLFVGAVHAPRVEVQFLALPARLVGVGGEGAGDEFDFAVERGGAAMHFADERAGASPDHAVANLSVESHWGCVVRDSWCVISLLPRAILRGSASSAASNVATRQQGFQPTGDFFRVAARAPR